MNQFFVGSQGGPVQKVASLLLKFAVTEEEAGNLAAWLLMIGGEKAIKAYNTEVRREGAVSLQTEEIA